MKHAYKGFCTFNDVEDTRLRTWNRATVLANLAEDNYERFVTGKGANLITGYLEAIPATERESVYEAFLDKISERGINVPNIVPARV